MCALVPGTDFELPKAELAATLKLIRCFAFALGMWCRRAIEVPRQGPWKRTRIEEEIPNNGRYLQRAQAGGEPNLRRFLITVQPSSSANRIVPRKSDTG